ncbi:class I SAM-dependent methyltransferase [Ruegeria sp. 2205SS24-7]|uniref:class I SAM-dependent DNA methyltransferase n=1 Tax=Ruegeria discodermiae TaxID=3064389 RepID=UPI0027420E4E|nr:class I SAM-dependent methyltransferase [Ruegeria sp. 2205SS24-7]MDP5218159.1 class I SAM-dependent methyltransferase [Ruegeria sp. 2205SS24-7]
MSDETLRIYDEKASEYADLTSDYSDPLLDDFIARLPPGSTILDLGCGPGNAAAAMARAGHKVDALDGSAEMVALADTHPGVTAKLATFEQLQGSDLYDGVWANFSLLHAARDAFPAHLAAIMEALKPGGLFHIGMKLGNDAGPDRIGRFYTYYTQEGLEDRMMEAGFTLIDQHFGSSEGLDGQMADWIVMRAHG